MSILSKLTGTAQTTAGRGKNAAARGAAGRGGMGAAGGGTGRRSAFGGFSRKGTPPTGRRPAGRGAPAASGGLGKLLGSLTGRR